MRQRTTYHLNGIFKGIAESHPSATRLSPTASGAKINKLLIRQPLNAPFPS
jgi:hypothetical protein